MVFLLVLIFFIMGLVGFLICHVLKKKGYRCRTFRDELDPDNKDVLAELQASECWGNGGSVGARVMPFAPCGLMLLKHASGMRPGAGRVTCHMLLGWKKGMVWREQRGAPQRLAVCSPESPLICWLHRLVNAGGASELGTSIWLFPKQRYQQNVVLMNSQDLPNAQHVNYNPCPLQGKHPPDRAQALPLPF